MLECSLVHTMNVVDKHRYKCQKHNNNPSFSSTLLDVIYRSIDERVDDDEEDSSMVYKKTMRKQQSFNNNTCLQVEKQNMYHHNVGSKSGNIGSCLETETVYGFPTRPRPIRTSIHINTNTYTNSTPAMYNSQQHLQQNANDKNVDQVKSKSRAMKIYGYLKKGKQPISPGGGRLARFLVSLFTTKYVKKSNISSPCIGRHDEVAIHNASRKSKSNSVSGSMCSLTTPKSSNGMKRCVRFYPGNEAEKQHSQPRENRGRFDLSASSVVMDRDRCIKERTRNLLKNYEKKVEYVFDSIRNNVTNKEDEDDDETGSYASSDLFELDHLSAIGIDQELPLYETTSVAANRAIANGFVV